MPSMIYAAILLFVCATLSFSAFAFVVPVAGRKSNSNSNSNSNSLGNSIAITTTTTRMMPSDVVDLGLLSVVIANAPLQLQELASLALADAAAADAQNAADVVAETARGEFYFFFFAGSGAGGIGLLQLPKFLEYIRDNRDLDGVGPTKGGEKIDTGIFASLVYPTLYQSDVADILKKLPAAETIVTKGNSNGYLASKGYVVRDDFDFCLGESCNPLAKRATFDALSSGKSEILSPIDFNDTLERYRSRTEDLVADLQAAVFTKLAAFSTLLFLLAGLAWVIEEEARKGFF